MKGLFRIAIVCGLCLALIGLEDPRLLAETSRQLRTVTLMPFGIFNIDEHSIDMTQKVTEELEKRDLKVVSQKELENFLAKKRIRRVEFLDRSTIRAMGTALNTDALVMGSVSILSSGENPHISINAQMVDCLNAAVIWANSVSRTGADYAGFLGLGRITTLEKLVGVVVGELFENLPVKVTTSSLAPAPFEIVHASFYPDAIRSGETAQLSLELKEIVGKVRDLRAYVMDSEISLQTREGRFFKGTAVAPSMEGAYPLKVYVTDRWNRVFGLDAVASLTVHNTPPKIILSPRQKLVSPNRDGVSDFVLFVPEVLEPIALESWKVEITDEEGRVVRSEAGVGGLPQGFMWRGVNDQHRPVNDGVYYCRIIAHDEAGNTTTAFSEGVVVDMAAPEVVINVHKENEQGVVLAIDVKDKSQIDYWELFIYDNSGQEIERFEGTGNLPETVMVALAEKKKARPGCMARNSSLITPWWWPMLLGIG